MKTVNEFAKEYYNLPTSKIETVYLESAIKFAEKYANQDRWIKVSERLPDVEVRVALYVSSFNDGYICIGKLKSDGLYYKDKGTISRPMEIVTHWQPLPEPPKD